MKKLDKILRIICLFYRYMFLIIGVLACLYIAGYEMFIHSIITVCEMYDAGTLTAVIVGKTVIKCIFAGPVCKAIMYFSYCLNLIMNNLSR